MPMLSIIIPTFNSAKTIGRCLGSVGNQTFSDFEIIIQDGFSRDRTLEIIHEFQQANNRMEVRTVSVTDHGIYDAMNRAVSRARGAWLYFLGSDDELHNEHVLKAVLSSEHVEHSDVLYGNVRVIGDCDWAAHDSLYDGPFDLQKLLNRNICHQAIFYRANFARLVGTYNQDYRGCADWDFNLRCWALSRFKYLDLTVARVYAGGFTSDNHMDEPFRRDIAVNVMRYFKFSLLNPLVNTPSFVGLSKIIDMQRTKGKLHSLSGRAVRHILRLRGQTRTG
jgi:glycosyltransferase involved in cell wall biosynthesis